MQEYMFLLSNIIKLTITDKNQQVSFLVTWKFHEVAQNEPFASTADTKLPRPSPTKIKM